MVASKETAEKTLSVRNIIPCPFCSSKKVGYWSRATKKAGEYKIAIRCKKCGCTGPVNEVTSDNPYTLTCVETALDSWGTRDNGYEEDASYNIFGDI